MSAERDSCDSSPYLMVSQCATDMGEGRVWRERREGGEVKLKRPCEEDDDDKD